METNRRLKVYMSVDLIKS